MSALSQDVFDAVIFGDGEPLEDAHIIWTTLKEKYDKSKYDEKLLSSEDHLRSAQLHRQMKSLKWFSQKA